MDDYVGVRPPRRRNTRACQSELTQLKNERISSRKSTGMEGSRKGLKGESEDERQRRKPQSLETKVVGEPSLAGFVSSKFVKLVMQMVQVSRGDTVPDTLETIMRESGSKSTSGCTVSRSFTFLFSSARKNTVAQWLKLLCKFRHKNTQCSKNMEIRWRLGGIFTRGEIQKNCENGEVSRARDDVGNS
ncbi:hypothetical protein K0M31_007696 [Melipona bicolor]|uniref:Uncharacterized protein n=1 Tax=Melipona bicolor TaxID=60889 RepID=A0AA40GCQ9_9HYME|nr:hypothetical protein K0M31_007696 [Melipona bicolor]